MDSNYFTDGGCRNNGKSNAYAVAAIFHEGKNINLAKEITQYPSNYTGELMAIKHVIKHLDKNMETP